MDHEQYLLNSPSNVTMDSGHSELGFCALDIMPCLFNRSSGFEKPERKKISDRQGHFCYIKNISSYGKAGGKRSVHELDSRQPGSPAGKEGRNYVGIFTHLCASATLCESNIIGIGI